MNEFTKEELKGILALIEEFDFLTKNQAKAYVKIQSMIDDLTPEPPKSRCECGDKYHPNGAICAFNSRGQA